MCCAFIPKSPAINDSGKKKNVSTVNVFIISFCFVDKSELFVSRSSVRESCKFSKVRRIRSYAPSRLRRW